MNKPSQELKPCPFCGGEAVMWDNKGTQADIRCGECDIGYEFQVTDYCSYDVRFKEGNSLNMNTLEYPAEVRQPVIDELVKSWNTRADDSHLAAENERLRKLLGEAEGALETVTESLHNCYEDYMHNSTTGCEIWERLGCDDILGRSRETLTKIRAEGSLDA